MKRKKKSRKDAPPLIYPVTGVFRGKSTVAYALDLSLLPKDPFRDELARAYLAFLEKESGRERDGVRYGALKIREAGGERILFAAFSPFSSREEVPVARFTLSPEGALAAFAPLRRRRGGKGGFLKIGKKGLTGEKDMVQ